MEKSFEKSEEQEKENTAVNQLSTTITRTPAAAATRSRTTEKSVTSRRPFIHHLSSSSACSAYDMTPDKVFAPSTENDYNVNDLSSADETDDEENPRKRVPKWAEKSNLRAHVIQLSTRCPDKQPIYAHFGEVKTPRIDRIFPRKTRSQQTLAPLNETTSWDSPIGNPRAAPLLAEVQNKKRVKR